MRIHAIDNSGSFYVVRQKVFCALRTHAEDDDLIIMFGTEVGKPRRWRDVKAAGHEALFQNVFGGTDLMKVFQWMDNRFISHHDTLIIYSDFECAMPSEDSFYRTEFVDVYGNSSGPFPNSNVFRVGDYEEGYRVLPWPEHRALRPA